MSGEAGFARTEAADGRPSMVEEIAGLHGSFVFPERLLQQIWLRGEFDMRALRLRDGRSLRIVRRGRWNRLAGPDFRDAEIVIGEAGATTTLRGDIEVHLRAGDWDLHGHAQDAAYDGVMLHVVLFPSPREWTAGGGGRRIPILELLPLLKRDLEAYAEDAAVEALAGRPYSQLRAALTRVPTEVLAGEIERHAERRWAAKVALAGRRIENLGWAEACHRTALEILGYRPNRAPMLAIAERWPLSAWRAGRASIDEMWKSEEDAWRRGGVRPANQPRVRLAQYAGWVSARANWPEVLAELGEAMARAASPLLRRAEGGAGGVDGGKPDLRARRKALGASGWRKSLLDAVTGNAVGGSRFDTMVCDGWLPLLAARATEPGRPGGGVGTVDSFRRWWLDWVPGDAPTELLRLAREFQVGGGQLSQGHIQGLLGWLAALLARDRGGT